MGGSPNYNYPAQPTYGEGMADAMKAQMEMLTGQTLGKNEGFKELYASALGEEGGTLADVLRKFEAPLRKETAQIDTDVMRQTLLGGERVIPAGTLPDDWAKDAGLEDWETEKKEVLLRYWISREIPKKYCEIFAPNVNAKCLDLKVIELMRQFATGSMRPVGYLFVSGIFELANNDKIIIPLKYIYDYKKFIASLEN